MQRSKHAMIGFADCRKTKNHIYVIAIMCLLCATAALSACSGVCWDRHDMHGCQTSGRCMLFCSSSSILLSVSARSDSNFSCLSCCVCCFVNQLCLFAAASCVTNQLAMVNRQGGTAWSSSCTQCYATVHSKALPSFIPAVVC